MSKSQNDPFPKNSTNAGINNDAQKSINNNVVQQFQIILIVVFILLALFLGYFVYNLIKCYLPKWKKNKLPEETNSVEVR